MKYYTLEGGQYVEASPPVRWEVSKTAYDSMDMYLGSNLVACVLRWVESSGGKPCYIASTDTHIMPIMRDEYPTKEDAMQAVEEKFGQFWRGEL